MKIEIKLPDNLDQMEMDKLVMKALSIIPSKTGKKYSNYSHIFRKNKGTVDILDTFIQVWKTKDENKNKKIKIEISKVNQNTF